MFKLVAILSSSKLTCCLQTQHYSFLIVEKGNFSSCVNTSLSIHSKFISPEFVDRRSWSSYSCVGMWSAKRVTFSFLFDLFTALRSQLYSDLFGWFFWMFANILRPYNAWYTLLYNIYEFYFGLISVSIFLFFNN